MNWTLSIYKLPKVQNLLNQISKSSHSILLQSKDSIFLESFAKLIVLKCLHDKDVCFDCATCKKILGDTALDCQKYGFQKPLVVEDSQNIVAESYVVPFEFENKFFIINSIDKATVSAQNKLLKIIEEPQKFDRYIFLTNSIDAVLPTIKSRCTQYTLPNFDDSEIFMICKSIGIDITDKTSQVAYANGNLSKLVEILQDQNFADMFNLALSVLTNMKNSSGVLEYSSKISNYKNNFVKFVDIFYSFFADMLCIKQGFTKSIQNKLIITQLNLLASSYSELALIKIIEYTNSLMANMRFNINLNLTIDSFLLKILEIKFLCK